MDVAFARHLASVVAHERSEAEAYLAFRMAKLQAAGDLQVRCRKIYCTGNFICATKPQLCIHVHAAGKGD